MTQVNQVIEKLKFSVAIPSEAYGMAEKFSRQQHHPQKAKQVYLNTLAVYAGNYFIEYLELETNLSGSDSWNPVMQTLMDTADLEVKNFGKLEFRPVLVESQSQVVHIPLEVWEDRIGYVAVQIDRSRSLATLLGFVKTVVTEEIAIDQFQPLEDLLDLLNPVQQPVQLRQWLQNIFEPEWQAFEALLKPELRNPAYATRKVSKEALIRAKFIDLEMHLKGQAATLSIGLTPDDKLMEIRVRLHPALTAKYLPPNLKLALLTQAGRVIREVESRNQNTCIQLEPFKYEMGRSFRIRVALGDVSVMEDFFAV